MLERNLSDPKAMGTTAEILVKQVVLGRDRPVLSNEFDPFSPCHASWPHSEQILHPSRGSSSVSNSVKTDINPLFFMLALFLACALSQFALISAVLSGFSISARDSSEHQKNTLPLILFGFS